MTQWFNLEVVWSRIFVEALAHFLWQGAAIAIVAGLAGWVLRRTRPELRYAVYVGAMVAMAGCIPLTLWALASGQGGDVFLAQGAATDSVPEAQPKAAPPLGSVTQVAPLPAPVAAQASSTPATGELPAMAAARAWTWEPFLRLAWWAWHGGMAALLFRLALSLTLSARLGKASTAVDEAVLLTALGRQAKQLGLAAAPAVGWCEGVAVPTVVGVIRPMVLLPVSMATGFTASQIEMILCHELAHIRRYDPVVNLFQRLVEALLFYHPAVWYVSHRIRAEREHCCDDTVVRLHGSVRDYADSLVRLASQGRQPVPAAGVAAGGEPSRLVMRVLRLLEGPEQARVRLLRGRGLLGLLLVAFLGLGAALYSQAASEAGAGGAGGKADSREMAGTDGHGQTRTNTDELVFEQAPGTMVAANETGRGSSEDAAALPTQAAPEDAVAPPPPPVDRGERLEPVVEELRRALAICCPEAELETHIVPAATPLQVAHLALLITHEGDAPGDSTDALIQAVESIARNHALTTERRVEGTGAPGGGMRYGFVLHPPHEELQFLWKVHESEACAQQFGALGLLGGFAGYRVTRPPIADTTDLESLAPDPKHPERVQLTFSEAAAQRITGLSERQGHCVMGVLTGDRGLGLLRWTPGMRKAVLLVSDGRLPRLWEATRPQAEARRLARDFLGIAADAPWYPVPGASTYETRLQIRSVADPAQELDRFDYFPWRGAEGTRWVPAGVLHMYEGSLVAVRRAAAVKGEGKEDLTLEVAEGCSQELAGIPGDIVVVLDGEVLGIIPRAELKMQLELAGVPAAKARAAYDAWAAVHPDEARKLAAETVPETEEAGTDAAGAALAGLSLRWVVEVGSEEPATVLPHIDINERALLVANHALATLDDVELLKAADNADHTGTYSVLIRLSEEAGKALLAETEKNVGREMAIVFDGKIVSAPVVRAPVGHSLQIATSSPQIPAAIVAAWEKASGLPARAAEPEGLSLRWVLESGSEEAGRLLPRIDGNEEPLLVAKRAVVTQEDMEDVETSKGRESGTYGVRVRLSEEAGETLRRECEANTGRRMAAVFNGQITTVWTAEGDMGRVFVFDSPSEETAEAIAAAWRRTLDRGVRGKVLMGDFVRTLGAGDIEGAMSAYREAVRTARESVEELKGKVDTDLAEHVRELQERGQSLLEKAAESMDGLDWSELKEDLDEADFAERIDTYLEQLSARSEEFAEEQIEQARRAAETLKEAWGLAGAVDQEEAPTFSALATPEYQARMAEGDLPGAIDAYVEWIRGIPVEEGRDLKTLEPVFEHFKAAHRKAGNHHTLMNAVIDALLERPVDSSSLDWHDAGDARAGTERRVDSLLTWRLHALRGYVTGKEHDPLNQGNAYYQRAIDTYPPVPYEDPATQSGLPRLVNKVLLSTSLLILGGGLTEREELFFSVFEEDARFCYVDIEPWRKRYKARFQPRRIEAFLERAIGAYEAKAEKLPERAAVLRRSAEQARQELRRLRGEEAPS